MMRSNAPIPAFLAFAALYLLPASGLAKPTHPHVHKTNAEAPTRRRPTAVTAHTAVHASSHHHPTSGTKSATTRGHTQAVAAHHRSRHAISSGELASTRPPAPSSAEAIPRKATSDDFLRAASASGRSSRTCRHSWNLSWKPATRGTQRVFSGFPAAPACIEARLCGWRRSVHHEETGAAERRRGCQQRQSSCPACTTSVAA